MSASDTFSSPEKFAERLRLLHKQRRKKKLATRQAAARKSLSKREREQVLLKTGRQCHVCGGLIDGEWEADHVFAHALGGQHDPDNYLPAHSTCNKYRWFYGTEEFQWILKLGVWLRTQIEQEKPIGRIAAKAFCSREHTRAGRRKTRTSKTARHALAGSEGERSKRKG